jgi:apolipoprotein N-acyltransferase
VTGIWGVTFVLLLLPPALATAWHWRSRRLGSLAPLAFALSLAGVVLSLGWGRLARPAGPDLLAVGLAATDTTVDRFATDRAEEALPVIEAYGRRVDVLASRGARVVVLPEKFVGVTDAYAPLVLRMLGEFAKRNHVALVAGLNRHGLPGKRNIAAIFTAAGEITWTYHKIHLVPGFEENYLPGDTTAIVLEDHVRWGIAICKDMDFPALGREYARAGVGLMLVPAWDFRRDGWLHARMAVVRGIEGGFAVARSAQEGLLTVSDDRGRIVAEMASHSGPEALLLASVAPGTGRSFYSRFGDWFAWICLGIAAAGMVRLRATRKEHTAS